MVVVGSTTDPILVVTEVLMLFVDEDRASVDTSVLLEGIAFVEEGDLDEEEAVRQEQADETRNGSP